MQLISLVQVPTTFAQKQAETLEKNKTMQKILCSKFENSQVEAPKSEPKKIMLVKNSDASFKFEDLYDIAKIFNRDSRAQSQIPMETLCQAELNVHYSKKKTPYAFSEAKLSMALFKRW